MSILLASANDFVVAAMKIKLKQLKFDPTNFVSIGMLPW